MGYWKDLGLARSISSHHYLYFILRKERKSDIFCVSRLLRLTYVYNIVGRMTAYCDKEKSVTKCEYFFIRFVGDCQMGLALKMFIEEKGEEAVGGGDAF